MYDDDSRDSHDGAVALTHKPLTADSEVEHGTDAAVIAQGKVNTGGC